MHLAYITGTYPQPSETFIAREVAGMRARGHAVQVFSLFAPADGPADDVTYGWVTPTARALRKVAGGVAGRALARRWRRIFAAAGVEAVVAHFGSLPSTVALAAAGDLPLFLSLHARDIYVEAERLADKLAHARATVTCTRENLRYLQSRYPAQADRIHLVYHGLPASWLAAPLPRRTPGKEVHLLAVGRLVEKKGYHILLDACARLTIPATLRILGEGPWRPQLEARCQALGLATTVEFAGWQGQEAVRAAYAWADVFCCPSVLSADGDQDGLPNVLVEAMATGLPAVGSDLSGIPEAIEDGRTGLLVPPGDPAALAEALTRCADPAFRARLGAHAAQRVRECFATERWLDVLEGILRDGMARYPR